MTNQPTLVAAGAALVIATTLLVAGAASQSIRFGGSPATRSVPTSPQQVERALVQVRAGEHDGLKPGWATGAAAATTGAASAPDKSQGHIGLTELAGGAITPGIAPNLPVGNWGLSEVRPNGSTLAPDSPSYSELVNQRRGEKYRIQKAEAPDAYHRAGVSIR